MWVWTLKHDQLFCGGVWATDRSGYWPWAMGEVGSFLDRPFCWSLLRVESNCLWVHGLAPYFRADFTGCSAVYGAGGNSDSMEMPVARADDATFTCVGRLRLCKNMEDAAPVRLFASLRCWFRRRVLGKGHKFGITIIPNKGHLKCVLCGHWCEIGVDSAHVTGTVFCVMASNGLIVGNSLVDKSGFIYAPENQRRD